MLETYLTVKTVFLLLNLALLLLYLILCGIALIQAVVERRKFQKTIKQLVDDEKKRMTFGSFLRNGRNIATSI